MLSLSAADLLSRIIIILTHFNVDPTHWDATAYKYWSTVASLGASGVDVMAVIKPSTASGSALPPNGDWEQGIHDLVHGGVRVLGYVNALDQSSNPRAVSDILADVQNYNDNWNVVGIFLDNYDCSSSSTVSTLTSIYQAVHQASSFLSVLVVNSDSDVDSSHISAPTADVFVVFEQSYTFWTSSYSPPASYSAAHRERFAAVVTGAPPTALDAAFAVQVARNLGRGWIHVTDGDSTFSTVPSRLESVVAAAAALNTPAFSAATNPATPVASSVFIRQYPYWSTPSKFTVWNAAAAIAAAGVPTDAIVYPTTSTVSAPTLDYKFCPCLFFFISFSRFFSVCFYHSQSRVLCARRKSGPRHWICVDCWWHSCLLCCLC